MQRSLEAQNGYLKHVLLRRTGGGFSRVMEISCTSRPAKCNNRACRR